jgi:hypothetical protein
MLNRSVMTNAGSPILCRYADAHKRGVKVRVSCVGRMRSWSVCETVDHHDGVIVRVRETSGVHDESGSGRMADLV